MPHRDSTKGYSRHQFPSGACGSTRTLRPCHSSGCRPGGDLRTNLLKAPVVLFVGRLSLLRRLSMALSAAMAVRKLRRSRDAIAGAGARPGRHGGAARLAGAEPGRPAGGPVLTKVEKVSATIRYSQDTGHGAWKVVEPCVEASTSDREHWRLTQSELYYQLTQLSHHGNGAAFGRPWRR